MSCAYSSSDGVDSHRISDACAPEDYVHQSITTDSSLLVALETSSEAWQGSPGSVHGRVAIKGMVTAPNSATVACGDHN